MGAIIDKVVKEQNFRRCHLSKDLKNGKRESCGDLVIQSFKQNRLGRVGEVGKNNRHTGTAAEH